MLQPHPSPEIPATPYLLIVDDDPIFAALLHASERPQLRLDGSRFAQALTDNRATSMAVGVLMDRLHPDRRQAFESLRARARSERRKVGEVAEELLQSVEKLNSWAGTGPGSGPPSRML